MVNTPTWVVTYEIPLQGQTDLSLVSTSSAAADEAVLNTIYRTGGVQLQWSQGPKLYAEMEWRAEFANLEKAATVK